MCFGVLCYASVQHQRDIPLVVHILYIMYMYFHLYRGWCYVRAISLVIVRSFMRWE